MIRLLLKLKKYKNIKTLSLKNQNIIIRNELSSKHFIDKFISTFLSNNSIRSTSFNNSFYSLILKKWVLFINKQKFHFLVYNYFVFKILYQTCLLIEFFINNNKNVLFVTDSYVENNVSFRELNCLSLNSNFRHFASLYGDIDFWFGSNSDTYKFNFVKKTTSKNKIDLAIILCESYKNVRPKDFLGISKFSLGFIDLSNSLNLWHYFIPVVKNKLFTAQILKEFIFYKINK